METSTLRMHFPPAMHSWRRTRNGYFLNQVILDSIPSICKLLLWCVCRRI